MGSAVRLLEKLRDRLVHRSLIGKRKLDRTAARRELDRLLRDLGERYGALVRAGRMEVPAELTTLVQAVRSLEERIEVQDREIAALESEQPSAT